MGEQWVDLLVFHSAVQMVRTLVDQMVDQKVRQLVFLKVRLSAGR